MKRKVYLLLALALMLAITAGNYAYTATSGSVTTNVTSSTAFAVVTSTKPAAGVVGTPGFPVADKYASTPTWAPMVNTASSITAGHLFYIDPKEYAGDLLVQLYLVNVGDLAKGYSYLNLGINFYKVTGAAGSEAWTEETVATGTAPNLNFYLTLSNGYVSFILPAGSTKGVITIDNGSLFTINASNSSYLTPQYYIDVKQA